MKKLFTLLTMLIVGIGSMWGQFVPDADTEYTLQCCSSEHGSNFIGINSDALNGRCATGTRFKFEATTGGYYIKVVDVNKYFNWNNGAVLDDAASTKWEFRASKIDGKVALAPVGTASNKALNNNGGTNYLQMGNFNDNTNYCSHWTIRGIKTPSGYNRYIGGITTGGTAFAAAKWKTQSNWDLVDNWNTGPGYTGSNMWSPIYLQDVSVANIEFEGWNLRLKLVNSSLTATTKKLQAGGTVTINVDENSTLDLTMNGTNGDPGLHTFNIDGTLKIKTVSGHFSGTSNNQVNLGTTGQFTFTADASLTIPSSASFSINATLTDPTEHNKVESRTLATFTNVTVSTLSASMSGTGWTAVDSEAALETQTDDGKYYYVEKVNSSGVTLHTYHKFTTYNVPASTTETLSEITDYSKYSCFNVPSGSTLIIDVDDFDLTKITGAGTVVLDANATFSGNKSTAASGKLTINEGKTLTIGGGDSEINSIESFTSIDLIGTIKHRNSKATLNNITIPANKTGKIFAYDMGEDADGFKLAGTTTLNGSLTVCSKWNFQMKVDELAGSGTWLICGTTGSDFNDEGTTSDEDAVINVAAATTFTGTINVNNTNAAATVSGNLVGCTIQKNRGTLTYTGTNLSGTTLDGVILGGSARINTSGTTNIKNLAGNNISGNNGYAFVGSGTLNFEGTCDLTHKADGTTTNNNAKIGYGSANTINIKENATVTANQIMNSTGNDDNAPVNVASGATLTTTSNIRSNSLTNNGAINATRLYGAVTLADGSVTTLSNGTPLNQATSLAGTTITGDATLNVTATTVTLNQPIIVAEGKTLTIDGNNNAIVLTGTVTNNGIINIENATIEGGATRDFSSLPFADYDNCTLIVTETTAEFNTDDEVINITNIPSYFTTIKLRRADRRYVTLDVTDGSATFTDSEAKVSGPKCLYDFTFSLETLAERKAEDSSTILNSGSRGSSNGLTYDTGYNSNNSYNNETGLLKVKSTPWRDMTGDNAWPDNYSVAVYANVPDVENGCLMAFGSTTGGSGKYLALIRGASSNEIKLVKGSGMNNAFEVIATMSAENATVAKHLVVFTKSGSIFKVYCDGVNVATTTYDQTLGTGFQIGSVHGGVTGTGIIRINDGDNVSSEVRDAVEIQSIRIFNGVLDDDQMSALMAEFPYVSNGGSYSRTISADANLGEDNSWAKKDDENTYHIPTPVVEEEATYYPDVTVTTSADATLTVNEDATFGKTSFGGAGTLTIAKDASGHSINVVGAVIVNSDVIVKFGAIDMSTSPVTKGAAANLTFDFSDFNFNKVYATTTYTLTGVISQDDTHITATGLPSNDGNRSYDFAFDDNHYKLTVTVRPSQTVYLPSGITEIEDDMAVKLTADAGTNNGVLIRGDELVISETGTITCSQSSGFCSLSIPEGVTLTVSNSDALKASAISGDGTLNISMTYSEITTALDGTASCTLIDVSSAGQIAVGALTINGGEKYAMGDYNYYISQDETSNDVVLVKHYERSVTSGRFGSICIENGASVSDLTNTGIEKVLKVTEVTNDRVVMDEVEDEMAAGVPYIFKSNASTINLTLQGETAEEPDNTTQSYLVGNFAVANVPNSTSSQMNYILQSNQFRKVTSETIKSGKNRCYLTVSVDLSRQSTLSIAVDEDAPTGIDAINALMNNNAEIYDINGSKLSDLRKGINIVNGVKVIVK